MWIIEATEIRDAFGPLAEMLAECRYGEGISVNDEALAYAKPRLEGAVERTYHFRLHETGETWWALEIVNICAAPVSSRAIGWLDAGADTRHVSYAVRRIPALSTEAEYEDGLVTRGRLESDAVLPYHVDRALMAVAIEAVASFEHEA